MKGMFSDLALTAVKSACREGEAQQLQIWKGFLVCARWTLLIILNVSAVKTEI